MLYPLKFKPIFKEKVWGGDKIKKYLGKDFSPLNNCGELWALSAVENDESVVENGFLKGNKLSEVLEVYLDELIGESLFEKFGTHFPVLIKFLNAADNLSVQVHPNDTLAGERHQCPGKNEMWYIIDADADSELVIGFQEGVDRALYEQKLNEGQIESILNRVKVDKGDVFNIPAGRVHAIGKGILLAEIQQTSDITYRIYDWNRKDASGMSRQLHTKEAQDAIDFKYHENYYTNYNRMQNTSNAVLDTSYFSVNYLPLNSPMAFNLSKRDSFTAFVCAEGKADVVYQGNHTAMDAGEVVLIPACIYDFNVIPHVKTTLLEVFINA